MVGFNSVQYQANQLSIPEQQTGAGKRRFGYRTKKRYSSGFDKWSKQHRPKPKPRPKPKRPPPPPPRPKPKPNGRKKKNDETSNDESPSKKKTVDPTKPYSGAKDKIKSKMKDKIKDKIQGKDKKKDGEDKKPLTRKELVKKYGKKVAKQVGKEALGTGAALGASYLQHRLAGGTPVSWEDAKEAAGIAGLEMVDTALQGKPLKGSVSKAMNTAAHKQMKKVGARSMKGSQRGLSDRLEMMENYLAQQRKKKKRQRSTMDEFTGQNMRNVRGYQGRSYEGYDYGLGKKKKKGGKAKGKGKGKRKGGGGTKKEMDVDAAVKRRQDFLDVFTPTS